MSIHVQPLLSVWVIALLLPVLLAVVGWGSSQLRAKQVPQPWIISLALLRLGAVLVFAIGLLQPVVSYSTTAPRRPELAVLLDTSQSMSLADGSESRLSRGAALLQSGELAERLKSEFVVRWFAFDRSARPITVTDLTGLRAEGETTQLADALRMVHNLAVGNGAAPARLLLVSDGNDHGAADPAVEAVKLGVAVDVLPVGSGVESADPAVAVTEVQAASRVLLGAETHLFALLRGAPAPRERNYTLKLNEDGREVLNLPVTLPAQQGEQRIELAYRPESAGVKRYTLGLVGPGADEINYPINVQVLDSKVEVLILDDTWRWEFKYLRRVFEDDPSFHFTALLPRGGSVMQFGSPGRRAPLVGTPRNSADLAPFDLVILGDADPIRWPAGLPEALARAVINDGKSLVLVAGPNLGKLAGVPELHSLLPVEVARQSGAPTEGPVAVRLGNDTAAASFLFDAASGGKVTGLPPLDRVYAPVRKRPAAHVVLQAAQLANAYGPLLIMAEHTVGRGRVLFIGTDTLWKWHTLAPGDSGESPHRTFWQQTARAMTPPRPLADAALWLIPDRTRAEAGQPVTLRALARGPAAAGQLSASAALPDDSHAPLVFSPDPIEPGTWRCTFTPSATGPLRISANVRVDGKPAGDAEITIEVVPARSESADTRPNYAALARLASATGGNVIDPADPATWPSAGTTYTDVQRHTVELWNDGVLLVTLALLLGTDWLLRLLRGFV